MVHSYDTNSYKYFNFGESFTYDFFVSDGNSGFEDLALVTNAPAIYIFTSLPSLEVAKAGTGALQSITTWADIADPDGGKRITIAAISDPAPNSSQYRYEYYAAVNYRLVTDGDILTELRLLPMQRPVVQHSPITTGQADLQNIYSKVDSISSTVDQTAKIAQAKREVKASLAARGYSWAEIWQPSDLNDAVAYRALYLIMLDTMRESGDSYNLLAEEYKAQAEIILHSVRLAFKEQESAAPSSEKQSGSFIRVIR